MEFDEIMSINRKPFEEEALCRFCDPESIYSYSHVIRKVCMNRYFMGFTREHGIGFHTKMDGVILATDDYEREDALEDVWTGDEDSLTLFNAFLCKSGWEMCSCYFGEELINGLNDSEDGDSNTSDLVLARYMAKELETNEDGDLEMLYDGRHVINSTVDLYDGEVCFIWSKRLAAYLHVKRKCKRIIQKALPKEYEAIDELMEEIQSPLKYFFSRRSHLLKDRYYIAFNLGGSDNGHLSWESMDCNAVISIFVLDLLLQDVMGKLYPILKSRKLDLDRLIK